MKACDSYYGLLLYIYKIVKLQSSNQHRGTCKIDQQLNEVWSAEFNNTIEYDVCQLLWRSAHVQKTENRIK